jgi:5,5'-dehydrodivanillate O-demethylase
VALTQEQNQVLTQTSRGTPAGELLRRYWHPIAAAAEFDGAQSTRPVRLLGEELVLYRMRSGSFGLIERHCPHRRADFANGYVEEDGIRCSYHGWKFGADGRCLAQPFEETAGRSTRLRDRTCAISYRAEARYGLIWAYLGPDPAPLIPAWEPFTFENCFTQIMFHEVACNWFQCQENSIDPVHFEWLHANWAAGQSADSYAPPHVKLGFDEWEHGFVYRRLHAGEDELSDSWRTGRVCIMPNVFAPQHFEWRVPIDDRNTLSVIWMAEPVHEANVPFVQDVIPFWWAKMEADDGTPLTTHVLHQDALSWVGQGVIADRTREQLGRSDRGIQLFRKRFLADIDAVERGEDPSGVVRDPAANHCIAWPYDISATHAPVTTDIVTSRLERLWATVPSIGDDVFFLAAGQPADIRRQWNDAMGLGEPGPVGRRAHRASDVPDQTRGSERARGDR